MRSARKERRKESLGLSLEEFQGKLTQVVLRRGGHEVRRRKGKHQEAKGSFKEENVASSV